MKRIRVGLAQVPPTPDVSQNLNKAREFMKRASGEGVEILCFPEAHLAGYRGGILDPDAPCEASALDEALEQIAASCRELSLAVVLGTETPNPDGKPFNSAVVIDDKGETIALHHKSRLTPNESLAYSPGPGPTMFTFRGIPMGITICFEGFRIAATTRELAEQGAAIVFHPQFNHCMPGMEWKLPVLEALLVARAAENTIYLVSANMSHEYDNCRSMVVAPDGLIQTATELGQEMLLVADLDPKLANHAFVDVDPDAMATAFAEMPRAIEIPRST